MDRLRLVWHNINRLEGKQKVIALAAVVLVAVTWLAACALLVSAFLD